MQKLHSFVAPTLFPQRDSAVGNVRRLEKHVPRRGSEGRKTKGWNLCGPKSVVSSKARSGRVPGSASGDPMMVMDSPSTADGANGSERTRGNQSVDLLTHRLERIELLNDHRDEFLLQCAQSRRLLDGLLCRTWLVEGDVASVQPFASSQGAGKGIQRGGEAARGQKGHQMGQPFMSVFAAFVNGLVTENPGVTGAGRDRGGVAEPISQAAHLGIGCGPVSRDVEHPRDSSDRGDQCELW